MQDIDQPSEKTTQTLQQSEHGGPRHPCKLCGTKIRPLALCRNSTCELVLLCSPCRTMIHAYEERHMWKQAPRVVRLLCLTGFLFFGFLVLVALAMLSTASLFALMLLSAALAILIDAFA